MSAAELLDAPLEFHGGHDGANYLRSVLGLDLNPFAATVADIVGNVWGGIYHFGQERIRKGHWKENMVDLVVTGGLATFDSDRLTKLVVLCHDAAIRLEVAPCSTHLMRLQFYRRQRSGRQFEKHPTIEQAVANVRRSLTADGAEEGQ